MLAPVHRSMDAKNTRESERDEWWRPRAEFLAEYVSRSFRHNDIVLLQEWWFRPEFEQVFDYHTSPYFERIAERRPGDNREDGMAVLIKKDGDLELVDSLPVLTGPQRIAQLVNCRHALDDRPVVIANVHLSFPYSQDTLANERRQACEVQKVTRALVQQDRRSRTTTTGDLVAPHHWSQHQPRLEVLGGDFNSNSNSLAAKSCEINHGFVNCASAAAEVALSQTGGKVNLGMTHKLHNGQLVSVDHIFARVVTPSPSPPPPSSTNKQGSSNNVSRRFGYLDAFGTRIVDCCPGDLELECPSHFLLSDHRPVTATLEWPSPYLSKKQDKRPLVFERSADFCNVPLDPLEPPSYMGGANNNNMTAVMTNGSTAAP